ncbi:1-propanol dehydrogenase PduQ [Paenibacillus larvae]|uniref:Aldehyde-alcohol dehydrogenase AdhE n=2 Tax=Paenibacillus larvae TaxID=1464 RepID=A0A2L1UB23_9BACL|nr:1-propanol dehydrogenase PduQ [Paenibacillus larvae]AQR78058.1 alcohol dehydrogenase [Paenibacillus larvae subsp. larvae]AQT85908.1 alcohol dehydrogenase [Paenibacillus larvae subsp. pulvifaciens]AQZ45855.1 alcohol dehydrogenase [Paenibacillus larvae subsp. pulvifaciens]AVF20767.1 aldehyde-alcohol dehydrogenase AdhE [Paenibacillus larvae subsp. larvae]AVF25347.1 aldehyde-alcohol dehydrogenase AdhE [Paenibacillus larvae subsp. larvae]
MDKISFKTDIYMGQGALDRLTELRNKRIFVVTDPFMVKSGMINLLFERLHESNKQYIFSNIVPDPPIEVVTEGLEALSSFNTDMIIAVGGGSAIDAAKAMKIFAKKLMNQQDIPFVAIPTTSGTGSEVTSFSVISDKKKNIKYPLVSHDMLPEEAILDPELVKSVPDFITADTGMDVLTHAIEAYVSTKANDISDALAEKALKLVFAYLPKAHKDGSDLEAREKMHNASCLAGMAFNIASLGLNHGIAHVAGAKFKIAHGRMNSLLLPHVIEFNADYKPGYGKDEGNAAAARYAEISRSLGLPASNSRSGVRSLVQAIKQLQKQLKMPQTLKDCNIAYSTLEEMQEAIAQGALKDGCTATNPRVPSDADVIGILNKMYQ